MISISVLKRFLIVWISLLPLISWTQTIDECYEYASSQMEMGNYENAIESFHRVLYFDGGVYTADAMFKLAKTYLLSGEYKKANVFFDQAYALAVSDSLRSEIIFEKSIAFTLSENYYFALMELMNIPENAPLENRKRVHFHLGINYFQVESFEASKKEFRKYLALSDTAKLDSLDIWFSELKKLKRYKPNVAGVISVIVPGSGQLYSGYPGDALNSFLLVGSLEALFFVVAARYSLLDAYLTVFPWLQRYMFGGFKAAKRLNSERRIHRKDEIYRSILKGITS